MEGRSLPRSSHLIPMTHPMNIHKWIVYATAKIKSSAGRWCLPMCFKISKRGTCRAIEQIAHSIQYATYKYRQRSEPARGKKLHSAELSKE